MGEKLGKPLVEVVGQPRVLPKSLPRPRMVPTEAPVKEKVPLKAIQEQAYDMLEACFPKIADFFGVSDQRLADIIVALVEKLGFVNDEPPPRIGSRRPFTERT